MTIRDLILSDDPQRALQELRFQWTEMSNQVLTSDNFMVNPESSASPDKIGQLVFELTSNTQLKIKVRGSDGVIRSVSLTLA